MQLTRFTDLGLRVLMYLTQPERAEPVTNAEIAAQFGVPHNHVIKVVHRLGKLGWIRTQRGRGGGISLGVAPAKLRLGDVLRELEGDAPLVDCDRPPCVLQNTCQLKHALDVGLAKFYSAMNEYTLADVSGRRTATTLAALHRAYLTVLPS
jgi:Rrf2 family nitric oxide-sensitive transcriptional repressor